MDEAIAEHGRAQELDPFNPMHTAWLGGLLRWEHRYDEAAAETRKALQMDPNFPEAHFVLGHVYQDQGKYQEAIAELQAAAKADPEWRWALPPTYAAAGQTDEARKILAELKKQKVIPWNAHWLAYAYTALGENDEAFRWFNYEHQHAWIPWARVTPYYGLDALRKDARFPALLRRWNLPPITP